MKPSNKPKPVPLARVKIIAEFEIASSDDHAAVSTCIQEAVEKLREQGAVLASVTMPKMEFTIT